MSTLPSTSFYAGQQVLVTGGLGFIGSNLAHALVDGGARVTILDALLPLYGGNRFNVEDIADKVTVVIGDIRDEKVVAELVKDTDIIYNLAAQVSYLDSQHEPLLDLDINAKGHLIVLEAMRRHAPGATVVFSSSRLVYGKIVATPVREDHPTEPLSLYGIHKLAAEKYYRYYASTYGLRTISIRIPNPYGPRQQMKHNKYSIVGWFVRQAMDGKTITVFGDGSQERDYLYIDDITDAFLLLTQQGRAGEVYNIGTHERIRFVDMVEAVLAEVGRGQREHVPWPAHYEKNETGNYMADTAKIEACTGWQAKVNLREGVRQMVAYYQQHRDHYWTS